MLGPSPFFIAGIVNVTPDSFHDGGRFADTEAAVAHGLALAAEGADILDVGGESTRPFAEPVDQAEELRRVVPVIAGLARALAGPVHGPEADPASGPGPDAGPAPGVGGSGRAPVLSVDTTKAVVAREALEAGALIVNDVSACCFDPALAGVLAEHRPGYVLMHSQGRPGDMQVAPRYGDVVEDILAFFEERLGFLVRCGLPESRVVLDPGIGFGKTLEHNLAILAGIERFSALGRPLYLGLSNKSLWEKLLGLGGEERETATQVGTALMAERGVAVHRVHAVKQARRTLAIVQAVRRT